MGWNLDLSNHLALKFADSFFTAIADDTTIVDSILYATKRRIVNIKLNSWFHKGCRINSSPDWRLYYIEDPWHGGLPQEDINALEQFISASHPIGFEHCSD